jgi:hypothetical protein
MNFKKQVWWYIPVNPEFMRLRKNCEFEAILGSTEKPCASKKKKL